MGKWQGAFFLCGEKGDCIVNIMANLVCVLLLPAVLLLGAGCNREAQEKSILPSFEEVQAGYVWKEQEFSQADGKKLILELPFQLEKEETLQPNTIEKLESYSYYDDKNYISAELVHGIGMPKEMAENFDVEGFLKASFVDAEGLQVKVKDRGRKQVGDREMTYLDVQLLDKESDSTTPARLMNVGFFGGEGEFWAVSWFAYEDDPAGQRMIERSLESIRVE